MVAVSSGAMAGPAMASAVSRHRSWHRASRLSICFGVQHGDGDRLGLIVSSDQRHLIVASLRSPLCVAESRLAAPYVSQQKPRSRPSNSETIRRLVHPDLFAICELVHTSAKRLAVEIPSIAA